jgi:phospholipid/cholesterol/gamma-HCH transport system substrate-binding protein
LTSALADRDQLIGQVVVNLNTVLGSLAGQGDQFAKTVDSLSSLVEGLESRKEDLSAGLAYANAGAATLSDLLVQIRPPLRDTVTQTDRVASTVLADKDYFDDLLNTLPDAYRILGRQALSGDYFGFYLCELVLKVNGKGGQPVYVKLAGQASGRCTPK